MAQQRCLLLIPLLLLWKQAFSEDLYFDKYGHCTRLEPFDLMTEEFICHSVGGGFRHENKKCRLSFRAPPENGVCLSFSRFAIEDCGVTLRIYQGQAKGQEAIWRVFKCHEEKPAEMCTGNPYVSLQVVKERLNRNTGYSFQIHVKKSTSVTEGGVVAASLGLVVGVIVAALILLVALAGVAIYCFKRKRHDDRQVPSTACKAGGYSQSASGSQPSAPPQEDPLLGPPGHAYRDPPPPYSEVGLDDQHIS